MIIWTWCAHSLRYWWSVSQLLARVTAEGGEWWPWTREYVQQGDMERSFLRHLITVDTQLTTLDADNTLAILMVRSSFHGTHKFIVLFTSSLLTGLFRTVSLKCAPFR